METTTRYVGLDVHQDTTVVAAADEGRTGDRARQPGEGAVPNDIRTVQEFLGPNSVETAYGLRHAACATLIDTHVMQKSRPGVRRPLDAR